jgi:hypothetical protein
MKQPSLKKILSTIEADRFHQFVEQAEDPTSAINRARAELRNAERTHKAFTEGKSMRLIAALSATEDAHYSKHYGHEYYRNKQLLKHLGVTTVPDNTL